MGSDIEAVVSANPFSVVEQYARFIARESVVTGTVVMHHGRVKTPGKVLPEFAVVGLEALVEDVADGLRLIAEEAAWNFQLHRILVIHRLGRVGPGDDVLLVICSAATRREAFAACSWLVDEIKKENLIRLQELPA
ncbi:MAG: molybdenum cofactor biosynthesis protein MoaE [Deltaproteobacteria bacterium]|nr:molybdenum cofactor biosynthesis protein MoaE [Deltaproteobacteria bacterium]